MTELVLLWGVAWCGRPALLDVAGPFVDGDGPPAIRWSRALSAIALERGGMSESQATLYSNPLTVSSPLPHEHLPALGYTPLRYLGQQQESTGTVLPMSAAYLPTQTQGRCHQQRCQNNKLTRGGDILGEWWEPHHEGECFASVAIYRQTTR